MVPVEDFEKVITNFLLHPLCMEAQKILSHSIIDRIKTHADRLPRRSFYIENARSSDQQITEPSDDCAEQRLLPKRDKI